MDDTLFLTSSPAAVFRTTALSFEQQPPTQEKGDISKGKTKPNKPSTSIAFNEFVSEIPNAIRQRKALNVPAGSSLDPVQELFE